MTKKISVLLALVTLFFAGLALAQGSAVVTTAVGTTQVQTGTGTPRALRLGDEVRQGDTVSTGPSSSLVMKFQDGEVTALAQNSRMTITAYQYEPASGKGNMLLSLVTGGMRAITGLLGRSQPERVAYRAATATIGIRGTDVTIATDGNDVEVTVADGSVTLTVGTQTVIVSPGQTYYIHNGVLSPTMPPGFSTSLQTTVTTLATVTGIDQGTGQTATSGTVTVTNVPPGGAGGGSAVTVTPTGVSPH